MNFRNNAHYQDLRNSNIVATNIVNTKKAANNPPNKENIGIINILVVCIASDIGITAPKAAPAETPKIEGSASGFLNNPWRTTPEIDKAKPTKKDSIILGSLISHITESFTKLPELFWKSILKTSEIEIFIYPEDKEIKETTKERKINKIEKIINVWYFWFLIIIFFITIPYSHKIRYKKYKI